MFGSLKGGALSPSRYFRVREKRAREVTGRSCLDDEMNVGRLRDAGGLLRLDDHNSEINRPLRIGDP